MNKEERFANAVQKYKNVDLNIVNMFKSATDKAIDMHRLLDKSSLSLIKFDDTDQYPEMLLLERNDVPNILVMSEEHQHIYPLISEWESGLLYKFNFVEVIFL